MTRESRTADRTAGAGEVKRVSGTAARRKDRVPLGATRQKLSVPPRQGYERRWINDDGARLQQALAADWKFVEDPNLKVGDDNGNSSVDSRVSRVVGKKKNGHELRAFLMEIEADLYKEDQAEKQKQLDEVDRAIKRGNVRNDRGDKGYVPERGIKIESETIRKPEPEPDDE